MLYTISFLSKIIFDYNEKFYTDTHQYKILKLKVIEYAEQKCERKGLHLR